MKKIIALFIVMLGISFTAKAQEKKGVKATTTTASTKDAKIQQAAAEDTKALNEVVGLTSAQKQEFKTLFEQKHLAFAQVPTNERKEMLSKTFDTKIKATLTPEQLEKLNNKPEVLKKITH